MKSEVMAFFVSKQREEILVPCCNNFPMSAANSEPTDFSRIKSQGVLVRGRFQSSFCKKNNEIEFCVFNSALTFLFPLFIPKAR